MEHLSRWGGGGCCRRCRHWHSWARVAVLGILSISSTSLLTVCGRETESIGIAGRGSGASAQSLGRVSLHRACADRAGPTAGASLPGYSRRSIISIIYRRVYSCTAHVRRFAVNAMIFRSARTRLFRAYGCKAAPNLSRPRPTAPTRSGQLVGTPWVHRDHLGAPGRPGGSGPGW